MASCDVSRNICRVLYHGDDEVEHGEGDDVFGAGGAGLGLGRAVESINSSLILLQLSQNLAGALWDRGAGKPNPPEASEEDEASVQGCTGSL